jgi:hypothetical protein
MKRDNTNANRIHIICYYYYTVGLRNYHNIGRMYNSLSKHTNKSVLISKRPTSNLHRPIYNSPFCRESIAFSSSFQFAAASDWNELQQTLNLDSYLNLFIQRLNHGHLLTVVAVLRDVLLSLPSCHLCCCLCLIMFVPCFVLLPCCAAAMLCCYHVFVMLY